MVGREVCIHIAFFSLRKSIASLILRLAVNSMHTYIIEMPFDTVTNRADPDQAALACSF